MIKAKLFVFGTERELLWTDLEYYKTLKPNTGRPGTHPMGGQVSFSFASGHDDEQLQRWMTKAPDGHECTLTECKIVFYQGDFDGIELFEYKYNDAALVSWKETFSAVGDQPMTVTMTISAAIQEIKGITWVETWQKSWIPPSEQMPYQSETLNENIYPEIVRGWWSYDKKGKERYLFNNDKDTTIPLGNTMYFHVETKGIPSGKRIGLKLYDYDHWLWIDAANSDTDEFPNDPVEKIATVDNHGNATVELLLSESWEPVVADDHDDIADWDHKIELYWDVSYDDPNGDILTKELPPDEDEYLRVSYNDNDLFLKPIVHGISLPEFYTNDGKLLVFSIKMLEKTTNELIPTPYISKVFVSTVRITETSSVSSINAVKKTLLYERVSWDTNQSVRFGYKTYETSNFTIKGSADFTDVREFEVTTSKKFSDYFNVHDFKNASVIGIKYARKVIKILDFINATKMVSSIFNNPSEGMQIPKPSAVVSAMGLLKAITKVPKFGALTPLFMATDVISTKVVNEIINEFTEDSLLAWERAKQGGLNQALIFVKHSQGAKMLGLKTIEYICQEAYEKVLCKEIKTLNELRDYDAPLNAVDNNYYTCFYFANVENGKEKFLIDCFVLN